MKKRRTLIVSLLLVAALALGIGYASLVDNLMITGTVDYNPEIANEEFDVDVKFTAVEHNDYCYAQISAADTSGDTVAVALGGAYAAYELSTTNQSAVITMTVTNSYESPVNVTADLTAVDGDGNPLSTLHDKFNFEVDTTGAQNIPGTSSGAAGTGTIVLTITPKENLTEAITGESFMITMDVTVAE